MSSNKISCVVVDDEPLALEILKKYIAAIPAIELTACCANGVEALQVIQQKKVDLMFLDIQMPLILGTDFIRTLQTTPKIIFTTAFREYAVEGFELDAVDFLLKPISFERFLKAVNKVLQTNILVPDAFSHKPVQHVEIPMNCVYVRAERKMIKILLDHILYVEGLSDYVKIVTLEKPIVTKQLLASLEESLPKQRFVRIHRSFIISIDKVEAYDNDTVQIREKVLPIGRLYKQNVSSIFKP